MALSAQYAEQGLCNDTSVSLYICVFQNGSQQQIRCCRFADVSLAFDQLLLGAQQHAAGKCGQCHVVSIHRKLNADLLFLLPSHRKSANSTTGRTALTAVENSTETKNKDNSRIRGTMLAYRTKMDLFCVVFSVPVSSSIACSCNLCCRISNRL